MVVVIGILCMHRILTAGDRVDDDISFFPFLFKNVLQKEF